MNKCISISGLAAAVVFVLCAVWFKGCGESKAAIQTDELEPTSTKPVQVQAVRAVKIDTSWPVTVYGTCVAQHETTLSAQVSATVSSILVEEGDQVEPEQVLARLDHREWTAQRDQAQAHYQASKAQLEKLLAGFQDEEIKQAASQLERANASYRRLLSDVDRKNRLFKAGMLRQSDYDDFLTNLSVAKADLDRASAMYQLSLGGFRTEEIKQMESQAQAALAAVELAEIHLGYCTVTSPIAGQINRRFANPGAWVTIGTPLFHIQSLDPVWIETFVPESSIALIEKGLNADIKVRAFPESVFSGTVDVIGVQLDDLTRCLPVKIMVKNPERKIRPGMFAQVTIYPKPRPSLVAPKQAVLVEGEKEIVAIVRQNTLHRVAVQTGSRDVKYIEIVAGLSENDLIVLTEVGGLPPGTEVNVDIIEIPSIPTPQERQEKGQVP